MPLTVEKVSRDVRGMFKRLKRLEAPDGTVLLVGYHCLNRKKVVTYVYIRVAQRVG